MLLLIGVFGLLLPFFLFEKKGEKPDSSSQKTCLPLDQWLESFVAYQDQDYARFRDDWYLAWYQSLLPRLDWNEIKHQRERTSAFWFLSEQEQKQTLQFPELETVEKAYNALLQEQGKSYRESFFTGDCLVTSYDDLVNFVAHNPLLYDAEKTPSQIDISDIDH